MEEKVNNNLAKGTGLFAVTPHIRQCWQIQLSLKGKIRAAECNHPLWSLARIQRLTFCAWKKQQRAFSANLYSEVKDISSADFYRRRQYHPNRQISLKYPLHSNLCNTFIHCMDCLKSIKVPLGEFNLLFLHRYKTRAEVRLTHHFSTNIHQFIIFFSKLFYSILVFIYFFYHMCKLSSKQSLKARVNERN